MLLVAPSEHDIQAILRESARTSQAIRWSISSLPEKHGCDFFYVQPTGILGFQRKTLPDLVASLKDGRLNYELSQIESSATVSQAFLIIESTLTRTVDGELVDANIPINTLRSVIAKWSTRRVGYLPSSNPRDTIACILGVAKYLASDAASHTSRPKQLKDEWGQVGSDAYALFLLQSFPNIGPKQAKAIYDHFGFVPIEWTVTADQLMVVKGIGRKTAESLIRALRLE
jgi:DNA excision repair protein ERCC-4